MPKQVVCISSSDAFLGRAVGRLVAERLGRRYVDEDIIAAAAAKARVDPALLADVEERKPLIRRLLEDSSAAELAVGGFAPPFAGAQPGSDELRALIRDEIEKTASEGPVVIVAHAASFALAGREGLLRVFLTASRETRARRLATARELGQAEASREIKAADAARADYLKRFYGVRSELPTHYDVVVNTDVLSVEEAAVLVAQAAG
jgi:Cytidylate kinase-like family